MKTTTSQATATVQLWVLQHGCGHDHGRDLGLGLCLYDTLQTYL